jgi:hypothetical protein
MTTALSQTIASTVGTTTSNIPGTNGGNVACAAVVNQIFQHVNGQTITGTSGVNTNLSVSSTLQAIQSVPGNFTQVTPEQAVASGQDYIIVSSPDIGSNGSHIGIGNSDTVWSNSSFTASVQQNYTSDSWQNKFGTTQYYIVNNSAEGSGLMSNAVATLQDGGTVISYSSPSPSYFSAPYDTGSGLAIGSANTTIFGNPNNASPNITPDQLITLNQNFFNTTPTGPAAQPLSILQARTQQPYSNRQFVSPINLTLDVEGVYLQVDFLQKPISGNSYNAFKQNSVLSTNQSLFISNTVIANNKRDRNSRKLSTVGGIASQFTSQNNLSQNIFNTGTQAITQGISNRVPNIDSAIGKIPYATTALSKLNEIPGAAPFTNALTQATTNPLGSAQTLFKASGINLQGGLPSASLGSLNQVFTLASTIASSGPPTSLQGIVSVEQQVKSLICNFKPPKINFGFLKNLDQILQKQPTDANEQVQHQKNVQKQGDQQNFLQLSWKFIKDNIINKLPNPTKLWAAVTKELTTCDSGTNSKQNDLSGKGTSATGPTQ